MPGKHVTGSGGKSGSGTIKCGKARPCRRLWGHPARLGEPFGQGRLITGARHPVARSGAQGRCEPSVGRSGLLGKVETGGCHGVRRMGIGHGSLGRCPGAVALRIVRRGAAEIERDATQQRHEDPRHTRRAKGFQRLGVAGFGLGRLGGTAGDVEGHSAALLAEAPALRPWGTALAGRTAPAPPTMPGGTISPCRLPST
jgi:hypothetical protein